MSVFANGTEWDNWSANWCGTCVHDRALGIAEDIDCPLILEMMLGEVPVQIIRKDGADYTKTICTKWSDRVDSGPKPVEISPGQLEMEF